MTVLIFADSATGAEFYKWVDKDGVVHFYDYDQTDAGTSKEILQKNKTNGHVTPTNNPAVMEDIISRSENPIKASIDSTFSIKSDHSLGTGFFISQNGFAITCRHVLENDDNLVAVLNDGSEFPIGIISLNNKYDLALIIVMANKETPYISVRDPLTMTPGDRVFAVGNYLGLQAAITDGLLTGLRENTSTKVNTVQFSAPTHPGNSGGPLVDGNGKVIGVVSWKIVSQNGIPVTDEGFAVPSGYLVEEYGYYLK